MGFPQIGLQEALVFDVRAYGAVGDGVHDDGPAWNAAIAAAQAAGGGVVYGTGTFLINTPVVTSKAGAYVHVMGGGEGVTTFKTGPNIPSGVYTVSILSSGGASDATFDSNGLAPCPLLMGNETQTATKLTQFARNITATGSSGSWNAVFWDMTQTYMVDQLTLENVTILGPSDTAGDAFAVSYVNVCDVRNIRFEGLSRSPNFYAANILHIDGLCSDGAASTASFVVDQYVSVAKVANATVSSTSARSASVICNAAFSQWVNLSTNETSGLSLNSAGITGMVVELDQCDLANGLYIEQPISELRVNGGRLYGSGQGSAIYDASGAGSVTGLVQLTGVHMDGYGASLQAFRAGAAVTWTTLTVEGGDYTHLSGLVDTAHITVTNLACRNLTGFNPVGSAVPGTAFALPASGTAWTNNTGVDGTLFVTGAGVVTDVVVQGVTVGSSLSVGQSFFVPAGGTITFTYSTAPTLVFVGN